MWEICFSDIVWSVLDRLKPFPHGISIQNLEIKRVNLSDPFALEMLRKFDIMINLKY